MIDLGELHKVTQSSETFSQRVGTQRRHRAMATTQPKLTPVNRLQIWHRHSAVAATVLLMLSGCGGGGAEGASASATQATSSSPSASENTTDASPAETGIGNPTAGTALEVMAQALAEVESVATALTAKAAVLAESVAATAVDPAATAEPDVTAMAQASVAKSNTASATPALTIRAKSSLAGGIGPLMTLRVDGVVIASVEVSTTSFVDYRFNTPTLRAGSKIDIVFSNDAVIAGADRNLFIAYLDDGAQTVMPNLPGTVYDRGNTAAAFDGVDTLAGQSDMYWSGALRLTWPAARSLDTALATKIDAHRFLQQASFGSSAADITALAGKSFSQWVTDQMALPVTADFVNHIQAKYNLGDAYRPKGSLYTPTWVGQKFWDLAANSPDQLRKRTAFALHQIFMVSQTDSNLWYHARAYANYQDTLNKNAFGNFRTLLEDITLSPAMGVYLSHMRNRKEDATIGRLPDENFAREVMQLFTIGLHELNTDGSLKRDANGKPIETYTNADVMALAKIMTGWSWAFPDAQMTDSNFRWGEPNTTAAGDTRIDLQPMKAYPSQHSSVQKVLFSGKAWATTLPANGTAATDLRLALDALFKHPNVGPFVGRQLIQRLVTSNPSAAYVGRVAAAFNNNGSGVRGDLGAVVRTILLDAEARPAAAGSAGKLREPVLRVTQWMRALAAKSSSGQYMMAYELDAAGQRVFNPASVFGYFRPGYVPPNSGFSASAATVPEFQIVNESTVASWLNTAEAMAGTGLGWTGTANDVATDLAALSQLAHSGSLTAMADHLNLLLLGGRMSTGLRQALQDAVGGVAGSDASSDLNRARAAVFMVLASPEYLVQQ